MSYFCGISAFYMQVGDPQEVNGIVSVFCQSKREPLLIGSTKSNMGHPEPASGLAALAKVRMRALLLLAALKIQNSILFLSFFFLLKRNFYWYFQTTSAVKVFLPVLNVHNDRWGEKPAVLASSWLHPTAFLNSARTFSFACLCSLDTKNCLWKTFVHKK